MCYQATKPRSPTTEPKGSGICAPQWKILHEATRIPCAATKTWCHQINKLVFFFKKSTNDKCYRGCGEKGTLLHCWWECKLIQPLWRTVWSLLKKPGIELPYDPAIPLLDLSGENHNSKRHMYPNVHCSTVYDSQDMEATDRSNDRWMDKEDVVHIDTMGYCSVIKMNETGSFVEIYLLNKFLSA